MAAISISEQLRFLDRDILSFTVECENTIRTLSPHSELNVVETAYGRVQQTFNRLSSAILRSREELLARSSSDVGSNPNYLFSTELQENLEKAQRIFTDRFLTDYPHAKIDYGRPCVSLRERWTPSELAKQDALARYRAKYPNFRAIRGDGNCFFSGFAVGLLEHLVRSEERLANFIGLLFQNEEWESPGKKVFMQLLEELLYDPKRSDPEHLQHYLGNNQTLLCCINHFRHIAADYMQKHEENFSPFLVEQASLDSYINEHVLAMGENAEHGAILALCLALQFPIRIHDIGVDLNDRGTILGDESQPPLATLCRHGEHYFFLYTS